MTDVTVSSEIAVPAQLQITVKHCDDELEIAQEHDYELNAIYCHLSNVLMLIGAILRASGMDEIRLIYDHGFACGDVPLEDYRPDLINAGPEPAQPKPKDRTAADRQRRYRANKAQRDSGRDDRDKKRNETADAERHGSDELASRADDNDVMHDIPLLDAVER